MTVTFVGHADAPYSIREKLKAVIVNLIVHESADTFYIGTHGNFDFISYSVMKEIMSTYPHIKVFTVLAYMLTSEVGLQDMINTILPEEVASSFPSQCQPKSNTPKGA